MIEFNLVNFQHSTGIIALNNIDVNIKSGELVALIGENGAGKTTFVKHINGLLKPTSGNVKIFGSNTKDTSVAKLSRKVGIVFQNPDNQLFSETVEDEIRFGLNNFIKDASEVEKRVKLMLNYFDLYKYKSQSPMLLSGGEKKRLCLAIVQAWNPEILILDEPTVGQDFINRCMTFVIGPRSPKRWREWKRWFTLRRWWGTHCARSFLNVQPRSMSAAPSSSRHGRP